MSKATTLEQLELHALKSANYTDKKVNKLREDVTEVLENELDNIGPLKLEFANSIEECTDKTKMYVLPDGLIYAYSFFQEEVFTDVLKDVGYQEGMRINSSGGIVATNASGSDATNHIPCKAGDIIRLENITIPDAYNGGTYWNTIAGYDANKTHIKQLILDCQNVGYGDRVDAVSKDGNVVQFTVKESFFGSNVAFVAISAKDITADSKIYVNSTLISVDGFVNNSVPTYWLSELEAKADAIRQAVETAGRNKSAFLWYTDAHWLTNSKMSPRLLKYLAEHTPINKVNFGGDIINDPAAFAHDNIKYAYEWRRQIADLPNHHSVYGNHDVNHRTTDVGNIAYALLLAPEETSNMVVGGDSYYYIDNPSEKTRYLYLSYITGDHAEMTAQGQFIVNAISGVAEGWHIVVVAHRWWQYNSSYDPTVGSVPAYEAEILSVFDAYNARTTRGISNYFAATDFTSGKGKVEFCIGGHIHVDYDFTTTGGIPVIITASDTNQERSGDETEDCGTIGTITESAVFGIIADYDNSKITVVGVGRGGSRVINH